MLTVEPILQWTLTTRDTQSNINGRIGNIRAKFKSDVRGNLPFPLSLDKLGNGL